MIRNLLHPKGKKAVRRVIPGKSQAAKLEHEDLCTIVPTVPVDSNCIEYFLSHLNSPRNFVFAKLNHGTWEALAMVFHHGLTEEDLREWENNHEKLCQISAASFDGDAGMTMAAIDSVRALPNPDDGFHFVANTQPWYMAREIEGTPMLGVPTCERIIRSIVPKKHIRHAQNLPIKGDTFKAMVANGQFATFMDVLKDRDVILMCNHESEEFFRSYGIEKLRVISVSQNDARQKRSDYLVQLREVLKVRQGAQELPPVVLYAGGETMGVWLSQTLWNEKLRFQFIDIGGAAWGLNIEGAGKASWSKVYSQQIADSVKEFETIVPGLQDIYRGEFGIRNARIVSTLSDAGVPLPASVDDLAGPMPQRPIAFIENKLYDHQRIAEILSLSVQANHHANGGPVTRLLEQVVAQYIGLSDSRRVVAVSNGTTALQLACSYQDRPNTKLRWVTSAFGFYSANVGPLSNTTIIDCDPGGRFSLERLTELDPDSFDGVIYTNVFSQYSDWDDVRSWCEANGKRIVIDNATGLFDRPSSGLTSDGAIETISAHHTKPWGVGECGFLIVPEHLESRIRSLANFGVGLGAEDYHYASNYKLSDLAAAAVLDRLERFETYRLLYDLQSRRTLAVAAQSDGFIKPFNGTTVPNSPRAFTPFIADRKVELPFRTKNVQFGKYYNPLIQADRLGQPTPNARWLFDHCVCLSNSPLMRLVPDQSILKDLNAIR